MSNENIHTATAPQPKGSQSKENPTQVNTLSRNPKKK